MPPTAYLVFGVRREEPPKLEAPVGRKRNQAGDWGSGNCGLCCSYNLFELGARRPLHTKNILQEGTLSHSPICLFILGYCDRTRLGFYESATGAQASIVLISNGSDAPNCPTHAAPAATPHHSPRCTAASELENSLPGLLLPLMRLL